jgi:hypothetical protein
MDLNSSLGGKSVVAKDGQITSVSIEPDTKQKIGFLLRILGSESTIFNQNLAQNKHLLNHRKLFLPVIFMLGGVEKVLFHPQTHQGGLFKYRFSINPPWGI